MSPPVESDQNPGSLPTEKGHFTTFWSRNGGFYDNFIKNTVLVPIWRPLGVLQCFLRKRHHHAVSFGILIYRAQKVQKVVIFSKK